MKVKIPQGVTKEDKLIGPLTLKQFLYILGGSSIIFIAYQYYARAYLYPTEFVVIGLLTAVFTLALAFANVNGRSFEIFLVNLSKFITSSKQRSWQKSPRAELPAITVKASDIKDTKSEIEERQSTTKYRMQIEKLSSILDTGGTMNAGVEDAVTNQVMSIAESKKRLDESHLEVEDILENTE